jgi:hypothetical protein
LAANIFGQNPADITGALFKAKNLADLPDKAAARTSLDVPSKAEVQYNSVPIGMIMPYWGSAAPAGYLPCSGQTITSGSFPELVQFLNPGQSSATIPDLRGEFLRGWDNGRGVDVGRSNLNLQNGSNIRDASSSAGGSGSVGHCWNNTEFDSVAVVSTFTVALTSATVATFNTGVVRPRNVSVLYCIKAYSSVSNFTSSVNIAGLVSDYSTLNAAAVKYADFTGANQNNTVSGYQKLPGGIIIQWGTGNSSTVGVATTLPINFPNSALQVVATPVNSTVSVVSVVSTTSAVTITSASSTPGCHFIAIGY